MTGPRDIFMALPTGHLPRVGKVRTGVKKEHTKDDNSVIELPSAVDYFVVNHDKVTSRLSAASFDRVYGKEPRELKIMLPAPRTNDLLSGAYRRYKAGELLERKCTGPGGTSVVRGPDGEWISGPCQCEREGLDPERDKTGPNAHCAKRWTFSFLMMHVAGLGIWQWDTGSIIAAEGITSTLLLIEQFRGHLQGAECVLRVVPRKVAPKGKSKTVFIVELGAGDMTPAEALAIAADGARRVELPPSSLDELPDPLLDHEAAAAAEIVDVVPAGETAERSTSDVTAAEGQRTSTSEPVPVSPHVARDGLTIDSLEAAKTVLRGCTPVQREAFLELLGVAAPATLGQVAAALLKKHRGVNSIDVVRKAMG